jgi:hypothetical protein
VKLLNRISRELSDAAAKTERLIVELRVTDDPDAVQAVSEFQIKLSDARTALAVVQSVIEKEEVIEHKTEP